ncbi:VOC family protein [Flagellimonas flava]|uniref:VOC family protein n=1 Tax=Flagellimonas flava TaxID=570519 RepID=UPI003D65CE2A
MKKITILSLLFAGLLHLQAQDNPLSMFDPLIGKTWSAEGNWGDGSVFKQDITYRYDINNVLVIAEADGHTNQERTTYGPRNHGIRKYDKGSGTIKFWEFDVFGGVTEGTVIAKGKDIIYTYAYGESAVTDYWEYVDDHTYNLTVGSYEDGEWKQKYLKTQFKAAPKTGFDFKFDHKAIPVKDIAVMGDYYRDVLNLEEIPFPGNNPNRRWFRIAGHTQLHLIQEDFKDFERDKSLHLCLSTQKLEDLITHLNEKEVSFYDWKGKEGRISDHRTDGVLQIYLQDPEGYWIEINDAKHD